MLYIVATPIGNLKDITLRALETLKSVDAIICEDTRRTAILLNHYEIKKPMLVLNDYNEAKLFPDIISKLRLGQNLVLVSDAGTPLIADPGFKLVRECLKEGIKVDSIPGASAITSALPLSNLPAHRFLFLGYPPERPGARHDLLQKLNEIKKVIDLTYILYVSPYKLITTFSEIKQILGNIDLTLASELTKIHQSVLSKSTEAWIEEFKGRRPKGEYVLMFSLGSD